MTAEQFRRWYTFALRMAHRGWPRTRKVNAKRVAEMVKWFFRVNLRDYALDTTAGYIGRIVDWDNTDEHPTLRDGNGRPCWEDCVGDIVNTSTLGDGVNPYYGTEDEPQYEQWDNSWGMRVRCCLRAGLDLASAPSAGVLGFHKGDLERMYRGKMPDWILDIDWHLGGLMEVGVPSDLMTAPVSAPLLL